MVNFGIYALILVGLLVGTWLRPAIALASLVCVQVLDFWGQLATPLLFQYGLFTNLFMVALIGLGVLRARYDAVGQYHAVPWVRISLTCLLIYAAISLYWSPGFKEGLDEWNQYWPYMVLNVWLVPLLFRRHADLFHGLSAVLLMGAGLAILVDLFVHWDERYIVSFWDPNLKFWNALAFAQMAGYVTLAAVLLNHDRSWRWAFVKYVAITACIVLAVKSGTRAQFILMAITPIVFLPMSRRVSSIKTYVSWVLMVSCLATVSIYAYDTFTGHDDRWSSYKVRSDWNLRLHMAYELLRHWWRASSGDPSVLMLGLGNSAAFSERIVGFYPHMIVLEVLGEEGLVGLGLLLLLVWLSWRTIRTAHRLAKHDAVQRGIVATLTASFVFAFLLSFKQGSLVRYGAEVFSFVVLIERQLAILAEEKRERSIGEYLEPTTHATGPVHARVV